MEVQRHRKTVQRSREEMTGSADKPSNLSEVCGHHIEKHPACQPHISGCPQANQKIKSIQEGKDRKLTPLDLLGGFPRRSRSKKIVNHNTINAPENSDFHEELPAKSSASQPPFPKRCRASGKKKRKQKDEETSDLHEELPAKSSASQPPFPKRRHASGKKKQRKQKDEETSDPEVVKRSLGRERSKRRVNCDNGIVPQQGKLDSSVFECYLENLWMSFSEEKRSSFTYLDCLWFSLYTKESYKAKVLDWIKKKQIFSKKYVFVPIVRWCHWSLLIFCNFGESPQTKSRTPCMLLLDSLQIANPQRLEPEIRKFVLDIYKAEERPEIKKQIFRIPLKIPKVPQQRNAEECGNFVLYYINLFIESAPENFSISEGYPYFMKKDWFTPEGLECFCKRFDSI